MKEQLISFETAKLAKEKGFGLGENDYVILPTVYELDGSLYNNGELTGSVERKYRNNSNHLGADTIDDFEASVFCLDNSLDEYILAPTQSLLQRWLREQHNINITIHELDYRYTIIKNKPSWIYKLLGIGNNNLNFESDMNYNKYEVALESGLQEALKLIK